jgi:hypothetical protein
MHFEVPGITVLYQFREKSRNDFALIPILPGTVITVPASGEQQKLSFLPADIY